MFNFKELKNRIIEAKNYREYKDLILKFEKDLSCLKKEVSVATGYEMSIFIRDKEGIDKFLNHVKNFYDCDLKFYFESIQTNFNGMLGDLNGLFKNFEFILNEKDKQKYQDELNDLSTLLESFERNSKLVLKNFKGDVFSKLKNETQFGM